MDGSALSPGEHNISWMANDTADALSTFRVSSDFTGFLLAFSTGVFPSDDGILFIFNHLSGQAPAWASWIEIRGVVVDFPPVVDGGTHIADPRGDTE